MMLATDRMMVGIVPVPVTGRRGVWTPTAAMFRLGHTKDAVRDWSPIIGSGQEYCSVIGGDAAAAAAGPIIGSQTTPVTTVTAITLTRVMTILCRLKPACTWLFSIA